MTRVLIKTFDHFIDLLVSQKWQAKAARHTLNRILGEGDGDPENNGEYYLIERVKEYYRNKERFVAFDVGANLGDWTAKAAGGMSSNWTIHAFEPSKETYWRLKEIETKRYIAKIKLYNLGLSDKDCSVDLYVCGEAAGTNSLYKRQAQALGVKQESKEVIKLGKGDKFCYDRGIDHIDFIKIDTEGHELAVLNGFANMLSAGRIDMVQFEYGGCWVDARTFLVDAFNYLLDKGYHVGKIYPRGVKVFTVYDQRLDNFVYCNYIAFKPGNELIKKLTVREIGC